MLLNATLWLTVTHTFMGNGTKLADWSKWIWVTLGGCFCSLLTSHWEVSTGRSPCSFIIVVQLTQTFVISSYIEDIETNLPIGKHTFRALYDILKRLLSKICFHASFMCLSRFVAFRVFFNDTGICCVLLPRTFKDNGPKLADWSKWICIILGSGFYSFLESNWKLVQVVSYTVSLIFLKIRKISS